MIRRCVISFTQRRSFSVATKSEKAYLKATEAKIASLRLWKEYSINQETRPFEKAKISTEYESAIQEAKELDKKCKLLDRLAREIVHGENCT